MDVALRNLAQAGIKHAVIVIGYAAATVRERRSELADRYGMELDLVANDRAEDWNNAYSLWLARDHFADGALLVNGDTVHPASVEATLLDQRDADVLLAVDAGKRLGAEEMKVTFDPTGQLRRIHKGLDPDTAHGEYIGVAVIEPSAADGLADALADTWRRDPGLYYEDGFQLYADRGGQVRGATIGAVEWVEVDDHADLTRAREIACRY